MTERGGPSTQAGIRYQNSIAALYLGDLLQLDTFLAREQVAEVRIEAPSAVDDVVVRYADQHREWVQVKLQLRATGVAWRKLWSDFHKQRTSFDFGPQDRLTLILGDYNKLAFNLRECAERALSSRREAEWLSRLAGPQETLVKGLSAASFGSNLDQVFSIFQKLGVEIIQSGELERDFVPRRMPNASTTANQLFSALRDLVGSEARIRGIFRASRLRQQLLETYSIKVSEPPDWGMSAYLSTVEETSRIRVPGTTVGGSADRMFIWPQVRHSEESVDFEDEQNFNLYETTGSSVDLTSYPSNHLSQCIVYAGPGFGKSALLQAISQKLASGPYVPAFVPLSVLADSGCEVVDYLSDILNAEFKVMIRWLRLCEQGMAVVLLDGLDEVPLEQRQSIITRIERFTARFPLTPWMLTVRDLAVVPAGFEAPKLELLPLSDTNISAFVEAWGRHTTSESGWDFVRRTTAYPDLSRLIRIPLFLSILLATWQPDQPLPTGRSDLIEVYLKTLFRPEEHKLTARVADPERLRIIAEHLSFQLLEEGSIGARERQVRAVVAQYAAPGMSAERLYDDLIRCGILRRQGGLRLAFPFPIVQEYLAACYLVSKRIGEVAARAERAAERPWAQVIQFALEMLPDASNIARALITKQDAFATTVRLVGRCILNGMPCDPEIRLDVGRRLAAAWTQVSHLSRDRIGQLLADGWAKPLLPEVRQKLFNRWLLHDGAGTILSNLVDDDLTESVLAEYLKSMDHLSVLGPFQPAVSRLGDRALKLYIRKARAQTLSDEEVYDLSSLIRQLEPKYLDPNLASELADDEEVAPSIRMAAIEVLAIPPTEAIWHLIDQALLLDDYKIRWPALRALKSAPDVERRILGYLGRSDLSRVIKKDIIEHLLDSLPDTEIRLRFSAASADNEGIEIYYRQLLRVTAASLGHDAAMHTLISELESLPSEIVAATIRLFGLYRSRELGAHAVDKLRTRHWTSHDIASLSSSLYIGASFIPDMISFLSVGLKPCPAHPAFDLFWALIDEWRHHPDLDIPDRLYIETTASSMGITDATQSLHALVTCIIQRNPIGDYENPLNSPIRSAVDELRRRRHLLDLPLAIQLAENSSSNARMGALYMISAHGTREALDYMIKSYSAGAPDRGLLLEQIEQISSRIGVTVVRKGTVLHAENQR
ncbi:MAG: NACHT domain-containing protein [Acidobacteriota bacterium]